MEVVLIILGVLGLGAIVISTYVFTVAARSYVSEDTWRHGSGHGEAARPKLVARNPVNRRSARPVTFPLTVNGILITHDRRLLPDRRKAG